MEETYKTDETIFEEGNRANRFYLILEGKVLLELDNPEDGKIPVQTLGPGDDLGWSWLIPPYYMQFSARALEPTKVIFFYGTELREHCEEDAAFGYELMKRAAAAMSGCFNATRQQLLQQVNDQKNNLQRLGERFPPDGG